MVALTKNVMTGSNHKNIDLFNHHEKVIKIQKVMR